MSRFDAGGGGGVDVGATEEQIAEWTDPDRGPGRLDDPPVDRFIPDEPGTGTGIDDPQTWREFWRFWFQDQDAAGRGPTEGTRLSDRGPSGEPRITAKDSGIASEVEDVFREGQEGFEDTDFPGGPGTAAGAGIAVLLIIVAVFLWLARPALKLGAEVAS